MKNIIWTKEELKRINKSLFLKANLKLNDANELEFCGGKNTYYLYNTTPIYQDYIKELETIFYIKDREKIKEVLTRASKIKVDPENKLHKGYITNLSKINPDNLDNVFAIYKEIIGLYEKTINDITKRFFDSIEEAENVKNIIKELKNLSTQSIEESLILDKIGKILIYDNGVTDNELFTPLIDKLNSNIKVRILNKYRTLLIAKLKIEEKEETYKIQEHIENFRKKYRKYNLSRIKKNSEIIYTR